MHLRYQLYCQSTVTPETQEAQEVPKEAESMTCLIIAGDHKQMRCHSSSNFLQEEKAEELEYEPHGCANMAVLPMWALSPPSCRKFGDFASAAVEEEWMFGVKILHFNRFDNFADVQTSV
ncbi:hypothetical protein AK812_SmicGene45853 [Symbiodinium microadriaticum]|uniref:Uncharacterized protein n=1 Tax=Symbiodinium microadriaticum TaxID=2951 RepID=A0A1Q9BV48_SYMMI|nr:hypothetical protein AK812_SmicGene45853 [Symbiodinium microadriaticum]